MKIRKENMKKMMRLYTLMRKLHSFMILEETSSLISILMIIK